MHSEYKHEDVGIDKVIAGIKRKSARLANSVWIAAIVGILTALVAFLPWGINLWIGVVSFLVVCALLLYKVQNERSIAKTREALEKFDDSCKSELTAKMLMFTSDKVTSGAIERAVIAGYAKEQNASFTMVGKEEDRGTLQDGVLAPNGQSIIVDGRTGIKGAIPGISDIRVKSSVGLLYDFTIEVEGKCPKGKTSNRMTFSDRTEDVYTLRIFSTFEMKHTLHYQSDNPAIVKITWDI